LRESEEEIRRSGGFKLIFPCDNFNDYKNYFEEERQMNVLLDIRVKELKREES
jgi:hypothetical protein